MGASAIYSMKAVVPGRTGPPDNLPAHDAHPHRARSRVRGWSCRGGQGRGTLAPRRAGTGDRRQRRRRVRRTADCQAAGRHHLGRHFEPRQGRWAASARRQRRSTAWARRPWTHRCAACDLMDASWSSARYW